MRQRLAKFILKLLLGFLTLALILLILPACGGVEEESMPVATPASTISLSSTAFQDAESIPVKYTCSGQNISPPLAWNAPPKSSQSLVFMMLDLDAGEFTHWILFNLPSVVNELPEATSPQGQLPDSALEGKNSFGKIGYGGPCPPHGNPHRYQFTLYSLDKSLDLTIGASKSQILEAMKGHILAQGQLMGTYQR